MLVDRIIRVFLWKKRGASRNRLVESHSVWVTHLFSFSKNKDS